MRCVHEKLDCSKNITKMVKKIASLSISHSGQSQSQRAMTRVGEKLCNKHLPSDSLLSALITILVTFCVLSIWLCRFLLRSLALLLKLFLLLRILVLWLMMSLWLLHEFVRLIPAIRASLPPPPPTDTTSSPESSDATIIIGDKSPLHDFTDELPCELCFECDWWWLFDWNMCWRPSRKWSVRLDGLTPRFDDDDAPWLLSSYRAGNDSFCFRDKII